MKIWAQAKGKKARMGATAAELAQWEKKNCVRLPGSLRQSLQSQDGGQLRYSGISLHPLHKIRTPDEEFWDSSLYPKSRFARKELVFLFGVGADLEPLYLLNFNAHGPKGEPTVHHYYGDPGDINPEAKTFDAFLKDVLKVESAAPVDWSEVSQLDTVLFSETTTSGSGKHKRAVESVLGRKKGKLFLYRHEQESGEECLLKVQVHEPLDAEAAMINKMPSSPPVYMLTIASKNESKSVVTECHRMKDGKWKKGEMGMLNDLDSHDKTTLSDLRTKLLGKKAGSKAMAEQAATEEYTELVMAMETLPKSVRSQIDRQFMAMNAKFMDAMMNGEDFDLEAQQAAQRDMLRKALAAAKR